jgi:hypothetical protein
MAKTKQPEPYKHDITADMVNQAADFMAASGHITPIRPADDALRATMRALLEMMAP